MIDFVLLIPLIWQLRGTYTLSKLILGHRAMLNFKFPDLPHVTCARDSYGMFQDFSVVGFFQPQNRLTMLCWWLGTAINDFFGTFWTFLVLGIFFVGAIVFALRPLEKWNIWKKHNFLSKPHVRWLFSFSPGKKLRKLEFFLKKSGPTAKTRVFSENSSFHWKLEFWL